MDYQYLISALIGYGLGCINPAYLYGKAKGIDIRESGSNNPGASNAKIHFGWKVGVLTAIFDILKGFLPVILFHYLFPDQPNYGYLAGFMAVLGHLYPFYMGFKGGKGLASYTGFLLATNWKVALGLVVWGIIITLSSGYIVFATFSFIIIGPILLIYFKASKFVIGLFLILSGIMLYKHKINIIRLMNGEEISLKKSKKPLHQDHPSE